MTVATLNPSITYLENGVTVTHPVPWRFETGTLVVKRISGTTGVVATLALGADYTATGGATDAGGSITKASAGVTGDQILIERFTPRSQAMNYATGDTFPAESHEQAVDRLTLIDQEQDVAIAAINRRSLMVPVGETAPAIASLADAEGKILRLIGEKFVPVDLPPKGDPGGDASQVGTRLQAAALSYSAGISMIRTTGYSSVGDGGAATYVRWAVPMAALVPNQSGYSWFTSADGAQWVLSEAVYRLEMFGAIGHATNDEGLAIRRTFEAGTGRKVLVVKSHWYSSANELEELRGYSNCKIQGMSALVSGFKRIANPLDQPTGSYGFHWQNASGLEINDIFHDVGRSGLGGAANRRVNGFVSRGKNEKIRLNRLIVLNATGYAFYITAVGADHTVDCVGTDLIAINSQVSFEVTGKDTECRFIRPQSLQYVSDSGLAVPYECGYHQYGGIASAYHENPIHRGNAVAVLSVLTDAFENRGIVYDKPDFEVSLIGIAAVIVRNDAYGANGKRSQADFIGGRIVNNLGPATDFTAARYKLDGTQLIGRTAALSAGAFSIGALRGNYDIQTIEPVTTPIGLAALGAVVDPTAVCTRTPTGSITATHLNGGPEVAVSGTITLVEDTIFDPPLGVVAGTEAPRHIQRKKGTMAITENPMTGLVSNGNAGGVYHYWADIILDQTPTNMNKFTYKFELTRADNESVVNTVPVGFSRHRRPLTAINNIFVEIATVGPLPAGQLFSFDIVEEA